MTLILICWCCGEQFEELEKNGCCQKCDELPF